MWENIVFVKICKEPLILTQKIPKGKSEKSINENFKKIVAMATFYLRR